jgi:hypothetical protein
MRSVWLSVTAATSAPARAANTTMTTMPPGTLQKNAVAASVPARRRVRRPISAPTTIAATPPSTTAGAALAKAASTLGVKLCPSAVPSTTRPAVRPSTSGGARKPTKLAAEMAVMAPIIQARGTWAWNASAPPQAAMSSARAIRRSSAGGGSARLGVMLWVSCCGRHAVGSFAPAKAHSKSRRWFRVKRSATQHRHACPMAAEGGVFRQGPTRVEHPPSSAATRSMRHGYHRRRTDPA